MKNIFLLTFLLLLVTGCTMGRFVTNGAPDGKDYTAFYNDTLRPSTTPFHFAIDTSGEANFSKFIANSYFRFTNKHNDTVRVSARETYRHYFLNDYRVEIKKRGEKVYKRSKNKAGGTFLIIQNDTVKYMLTSPGTDAYEPYLAYSVTKSIASLLTGIAIDKGLIGSVDDPVTRYIPELAPLDTMWSKLTIDHLLQMRSGLDLREKYSANPFTRMAKLFYGPNQLGMLKKTGFYAEPGAKFEYLSIATTVLGIVLERAIGGSIADFAQEYVWEPLGMERESYLALDSEKHSSAKMFAGLTTNALDLAKIGRLYLHGGEWNGQQIVSREWIERSKTSDSTSPSQNNSWWMGRKLIVDSTGSTRYFADSTALVEHLSELEIPMQYAQIRKNESKGWYAFHYYKTGEYFAQGICDQLLFIDDQTGVIVVRLGTGWASSKYNIDDQVRLTLEFCDDYFQQYASPMEHLKSK